MLAALQDRRASLAAALALAVEVEELCAQYWRAKLMGEPALLSYVEMDKVLERFKHYASGEPIRLALSIEAWRDWVLCNPKQTIKVTDGMVW